MDNNLEKIQLLVDSLNRGEITPEELASKINPGQDPLPSDDEIIAIGEEINKSLEPEPLILNDDEINDLLCQYEGEELGNRILWGCLDKLGLTRDINDAPDFSSNDSFDSFFEKKNLTDRLQRAKEMLSDNLDLDVVGIKFKKANLKIRNFKIAGFSLPLNIITHLGKPLFFHIAPPKLSLAKILEILKIRAKSKKTKDCEKKLQKTMIDEDELIKDLEDLLDQEKDYNDLGEIVEDLFCEPEIPINPETGDPLFTKNDLNKFLKEICEPDPEPDPIENLETPSIEDISDQINSCLKQTKSIFNDIREKNEQKSRLQKAEKELEEILFHYKIVKNYYDGLYDQFQKKQAAGKKGNPLLLTAPLVMNSAAANNFMNALKSFSSRFKESKRNEIALLSGYVGVSFSLQFPHGLGKDVPYEQVKMDIKNDLLSQDYQKVDITKLQLGMEFSKSGVLSGEDTKFLKDFKSFIIVKDENPKNDKDYFNFVGDIENTTKPKSQILKDIDKDHGFLYSNLIEISASPWLFFTKEERGDNDARKSSDIKPAKTDNEGNPNKEFESFWQDYKTSWDKKYNSKKEEIEKKITEIKKISDVFVERLADYYFTVNLSSSANNLAMLKDASEGISKRVTSIENSLLDIAEKITKLDQENSADSLQSKAGAISCANPPQKAPCPSDCCGPAGQSINISKTCTFPGSPDCPNLFTVCYWKEFCKNLNKVGLLPLPAGLPPIENPAGFLPDLGLKYWPVGYLPPSFIPLPPPIVNPLDGLPFIRIPMPMVWTKVDPIVIPIGIGVIVIFIPFIGGFMPSPLVYFHDFLTGNNIFLLGMRGFRFIPRKSDPISRDPLENYKKMLSRGIPNFLFPFSNLGKDDVDSPNRIIKEIKDNLDKRLANYKKPPNMEKIRKVQDKITKKKEEANAKILEKKRRAALDGGDVKKEKEELEKYLKSIDKEKLEAVKECIGEYLNGAVDLPDIPFPKKSKNLIAEIPSSIKSLQDIANKKKLGVIPAITPSPKKINLHSNILRSIDSVKYPISGELSDINKGLSKDSKIVAKFDTKLKDISKDPESMKKISNLISSGVKDAFNGKNSPVSSKSLSSFKANINPAPRIAGAGVPLPSSLEEIPNPIVQSLKNYVSSNIAVKPDQLDAAIKNLSIGENKVLRQKDIKMLTKNVLNKTLSGFPGVDLKNFVIPDPASMTSMTKAFSNLASSLDLPKIPPKKSALPSAPLLPGGIPQIIIPGKAVGKFLVDGLMSSLDPSTFNNLLPGGLENFESLTENDLKAVSDNLIKNFTRKAKIPVVENLPKIPIPSRSQDYIEFTMNFLPTHPISDIAFTALWTKFKTPPRIPIPSGFLAEYLKVQDAIFSKIPWPVIVVLGRNVVNLLNPLWNKEDIPRWDRMSLRNPFYVIFLDEFLRSATDISGGFKFFVGAGKLFYPLPDSEINLGFGTKISVS